MLLLQKSQSGYNFKSTHLLVLRNRDDPCAVLTFKCDHLILKCIVYVRAWDKTWMICGRDDPCVVLTLNVQVWSSHPKVLPLKLFSLRARMGQLDLDDMWADL